MPHSSIGTITSLFSQNKRGTAGIFEATGLPTTLTGNNELLYISKALLLSFLGDVCFFISLSELSLKGFGMAPSQGATAGCLSLSFTNDLIRFKVTKVILIHICHREVQTIIYLIYCCDYLLEHRVRDQNEKESRYAFCSKKNKNKTNQQQQAKNPAQGWLLDAWSFVLKSAHFADGYNWARLFCAETDLSQDFQGWASQALHGWLASFLCCLEGHAWSLWTWTHGKAEELDVIASEHLPGRTSQYPWWRSRTVLSLLLPLRMWFLDTAVVLSPADCPSATLSRSQPLLTHGGCCLEPDANTRWFICSLVFFL